MTPPRCRAPITILSLAALLAVPLAAQSYRVTVTHLEANVYQAAASKVIIETRSCADFESEEAEEAVLNWEGRYGDNWLLFTRSKIKCDVISIR